MKLFALLGLLSLFAFVPLENANAGTDHQCVRANVVRCLNHFDRPTCARLLRAACVKGPHWDRRCVLKHAPRCFLHGLTRQQCKRKLRPVCFRR